MCGEKISLAEKVGVTPDSAIFARSKVQFFDDLSDDEEYQNMTEEERNERMKPKLDFGNNLFCSDLSFTITTAYCTLLYLFVFFCYHFLHIFMAFKTG